MQVCNEDIFSMKTVIKVHCYDVDIYIINDVLVYNEDNFFSVRCKRLCHLSGSG